MNSFHNRLGKTLKDFSDKWLDAVVSLALGPTLSDKMVTSLVTNVARDLIADIIRDKLTVSEAKDIRERAKEAATRIEEASQIISELQIELQTKSKELDQLMDIVATRQNEAAHWANLASVNEELASSFMKELEKRVREQLRTELDKGKRQRQILGAILWVITLLIGAFVGALVQQWWQTGNIFPPTPTTPLP